MNQRSKFDWSSAVELLPAEKCPATAGAAEHLAFLHHRRKALPATQFDDTDWAILLESYVAELHGRVLATKSFEVVAGVSQATLLRHLDALEERQLVQRHTLQTDRRVRLVAITAKGRRVVSSVFTGNFADVARRPVAEEIDR